MFQEYHEVLVEQCGRESSAELFFSLIELFLGFFCFFSSIILMYLVHNFMAS